MRLLLCLALILPGCSTREKLLDKDFKRELASGRCDEALLNLPQRDPMIKIANKSEQAAGTVLSYAFVGASYTAEVLIDTAGGTVMFVALCGIPLVATAALIVASNGNGVSGNQPWFGCFPGKMNALAGPPLGRNASKSTHDMRCPNLKSLSQSVRAVATCYEERGGQENLAKAKANLAALRSSDEFYLCLPAEEVKMVRRQEIALDLKLAQ